jgi:hypothetical protein
MIPKKLDATIAKELKTILNKLDIQNPRVTIDFDKEQIKLESDDYSINDLLEAAGTLSPIRAKELLEDVRKSREEWDQ